MTFFEYAMVMVSIMLAIGLSQLLRAVGDVILSPDRFWPHIGWIIALVLLTVQVWWAYWDMHEGVEWNVSLYGFVLLGPALLLVAANILVPASRAEDLDWRAHLTRARRPFFSFLLAFQVFGILFSRVVMDVPLLIPFRAAQLVLVFIALAGLLFTQPRLHALLPAIYILTAIVANLLFRSYPAAFGLA
ncbi:MAG: hypothetical protein P8080_03780 [Gammaproteobacteria bacterium]